LKSTIIHNYVDTLDINNDTTCADLCRYRDKFTINVRENYGSAIGFSGITEVLLVRWMKEYYKNNQDVNVLTETKFDAAIGKQKLDIPVINKNDNKIIIGVSVKARTETSGYLDGADHQNPLIKEFQHHLKNRRDGKIGVPTYIQDMARIENLQLAQKDRFKSITITYGKINKKNVQWIEVFQQRFNHKYIFLLDEGSKTLREVFERELELIK